MSGLLLRLFRCERGASASEFALVLPLLLLLLLGMIDVGRFLWEVNQAEKATQVGARFAVVTTPVSPGLIEADFESQATPAGELIPADALGALTCTSSGCTCTGICPVSDTSVDSDAFDAIVARMKAYYADVNAENVRVTYRGSGFGFAGDAVSGGAGTEEMEISPLVTVSVTGLQFTPVTTLLLAEFELPSFATTLPAEDASGDYSN